MDFKETIGIDVSKPFIDAVIHSNQKHRQFRNSSKGFKDLLSWVKKQSNHKASNRLFAFEHTGLYSAPLSIFLTKEEVAYIMIPGLELKKSMGIVRGKTDKVDAKTIALYTYRRRDEVKPYILPSEKLLILRKLLSLRDKLVKQSSAYKATNKEIKDFMNKENNEIYFEIHDEMISILNEKIKKVEKQIKTIIKTEEKLHEQYKLITTIKGVGDQTAWHMIVYTNAFTLFDNSRKFASYSGVAPFPYQSGISIKGKSKVHQFANKKFKSLLSNCASSAVMHNSELRLYYTNRLELGKNKMSTLNIIRNKILSRIFAVIQRGTPYVDTYAFAS